MSDIQAKIAELEAEMVRSFDASQSAPLRRRSVSCSDIRLLCLSSSAARGLSLLQSVRLSVGLCCVFLLCWAESLTCVLSRPCNDRPERKRIRRPTITWGTFLFFASLRSTSPLFFLLASSSTHLIRGTHDHPRRRQQQQRYRTLKAKIAKLKSELINGPGGKSAGSKDAGRGFDVSKSGDTRIGLVGFPSVGKSTLLTQLTGTRSAVSEIEFTTLTWCVVLAGSGWSAPRLLRACLTRICLPSSRRLRLSHLALARKLNHRVSYITAASPGP